MLMMFYTSFAYSTRLKTYKFEEVNDLFLNFRIVIGTIVNRIINSPSKPPIIIVVNRKVLNISVSMMKLMKFGELEYCFNSNENNLNPRMWWERFSE